MKPFDKDSVVVVCDYFSEDFLGGAELTTQALLDFSPLKIIKIKAIELNYDLIKMHSDKLWIFGNFTRMKYTLIPEIMRSLKYVVIEYDYKFCFYRSPELHLAKEGMPCDCHKFYGKNISNFFKNSQHVFWMSEKQKRIYEDLFLTMREASGVVLSSVFSKSDIEKLREIRNRKCQRQGWVVVDYGSWIKGIEDSKKYCLDNNLPMKALQKMGHDELLNELGKSEGFVFMPKGGDSCPRLVIEAKLSGCKLAVNDNVQHKDEAWFQGSPDDIENYLKKGPGIFWMVVESIINRFLEQAKDYAGKN